MRSHRGDIASRDNVIAFPVLEWYFWSFAAVIAVMSGAYNHVRRQEPAITDLPADPAEAA